jgi:hypothetical protein
MLRLTSCSFDMKLPMPPRAVCRPSMLSAMLAVCCKAFSGWCWFSPSVPASVCLCAT